MNQTNAVGTPQYAVYIKTPGQNSYTKLSGYSTSSASSLDSAFAFDGSEAQSLTFGTNGQAGLKSMSMTSAGVVDVEVIDCGEY